jgi:hypothetical protein
MRATGVTGSQVSAPCSTPTEGSRGRAQNEPVTLVHVRAVHAHLLNSMPAQLLKQELAADPNMRSMNRTLSVPPG